jgi:hypothetical protein
MPYSTPSYIAGGNISPSRFVKLESGENNQVIQCVADDLAVGVSHEGTRTAPIPDADGYAAIEGETCQVYGLGEPCEVEAGDDVTAGAKVKPDADGKAIPAEAGDVYSAIARSGGADGEKIKIIINNGTLPAA